MILLPILLSNCMLSVSDASEAYFPSPDSQGGWSPFASQTPTFPPKTKRRMLTDADGILQVAGMDRGKLDEAFEFIKGNTKNGGLLLVRRGWLVYERYFGKGHHDAAPNLASCGKSVTSIAGRCIHEEMKSLIGMYTSSIPSGLPMALV